MAEVQPRVHGLGWVLPAGVGAGGEVLAHPDWVAADPLDNGTLTEFDPKPYLRTVRGYLDPAGAYFLAAARLALGEDGPQAEGTDVMAACGVGSATRYGAVQSAFRVFTQLVEKGPRSVSPLIFPHGYPNTPGNLAAMEFGFGGPHMVFYGVSGAAELLDFARECLVTGAATDMLVGAFEAVTAPAYPEPKSIVNGAVVAWLSGRAEAGAGLFALPAVRNLTETPATPATGEGSVAAFVHALTTRRETAPEPR